MIRHASPLILLAAVCGCAAERAPYPSLAVRAAEGRGFGEPEAAPAAPVAADPALDRQVAGLADRLTRVTTAFAAAERGATSAAARARGARAGSEAWIAAQSGLAELDSGRADTSAIATEAEQLAIARVEAQGRSYPALDGFQATVAGELRRQEEAIARLGAGLAPAG